MGEKSQFCPEMHSRICSALFSEMHLLIGISKKIGTFCEILQACCWYLSLFYNAGTMDEENTGRTMLVSAS